MATGDYADNAWRFGLYCRAALEALRADGRPVDVLHLHDWQAGPTAILRGSRVPGRPASSGAAAIVTTLHNLAYHGWTANAALPQLGLRPGGAAPGQNADGVDLLAAGHRGGRDRQHGLADLRSRGTHARVRDGPRRPAAPAGRPVHRDPQRAGQHGLGSRHGPGSCRALFAGRPRRQGGVPGGPARAGRLRSGRRRPGHRDDRAAGSAEGLRPACRRHARSPGGGWPRDRPGNAATRRSPMRSARSRRPRPIGSRSSSGSTACMARKIYAGADFFAMPSRFEPCGQGQMIALRYGTPPIVHRTGGLADTVIDATADPGEGTGFVFDRETPAGAGRGVRSGVRAPGRRRRRVGRPGRSRHGGRLRLGDGLGAEVRRGVSTGGHDPRRGAAAG